MKRHIRNQKSKIRNSRRRGAAAILAMMFLVIFASLAAAMAIVSQGNLATADSHLKINRTLAASETGMRWIEYRVNQAAATVRTRDGQITAANAGPLWDELRSALYAGCSGELHNLAEPQLLTGAGLRIGPITLGGDAPPFVATLRPHPLAGEDYNSAYYQRQPYSALTPPVSNTAPLDSSWVRVRVEAYEGPADRRVTRAVQMDFKLDKKIRFAILSKNRVMIGQNVMIAGTIGSRFMETHLEHGHPVQMVSDFRGLSPDLDADLDVLVNTLKTNDKNGDNRLNLADAAEVAGIANPAQYDRDGDGYIDEFDFFLAHFDANGDGRVSAVSELNVASDVRHAELLRLLDTFGDPARAGFDDGHLDAQDRYAKIRGEVMITAALADWESGAAGGAYQDYFQGSIQAGHNRAPITFEASGAAVHEFAPADFDVSDYRNLATGDLAAQASAQAAQHDPGDPSSPKPLGTSLREEVPYGAAYPYDFYDRPVYENMTFTNVKVPKGTNALFKNCTFIGCTFIETATGNTDPNYNYAGMQLPDGTLKHPQIKATVDGVVVADTRSLANNLRFDSCTFEGAVVSDAPLGYTHVRNKLAFTGKTRWDLNATGLSPAQKDLFRRSTLLVPHYSVELGTFIDPSSGNEAVQLSGTIVAGLIDMRGQVQVNGTILTTFEPRSGEAPVVGDTSPQFNTTLGYFASSSGDLEAEIPTGGLGVIQLRYDETLPLPNGILGPIELRPVRATYAEAGAK